jgi:predicted DNA-binding protein
MTIDENQTKVRRSIFIPQELEEALARLASERQTSPNDLIREILAAAVKEHESAATRDEPPHEL